LFYPHPYAECSILINYTLKSEATSFRGIHDFEIDKVLKYYENSELLSDVTGATHNPCKKGGGNKDELCLG